MIQNIFRCILTIVLLYFCYQETGIFTTLALFFVAFTTEIHSYVLKVHVKAIRALKK